MRLPEWHESLEGAAERLEDILAALRAEDWVLTQESATRLVSALLLVVAYAEAKLREENLVYSR